MDEFRNCFEIVIENKSRVKIRLHVLHGYLCFNSFLISYYIYLCTLKFIFKLINFSYCSMRQIIVNFNTN